jgi:Rrf2 family protein
VQLTLTSAHLIRAAVYIARRNGPVPADDVARAAGCSHFFGPKALKPLVSAGLLLSLRGHRGGYWLAKPADQITLLEIIEAADGPPRVADHDFAVGDALDGTLTVLYRQATDRTRLLLAKVSVADLAQE